MRRSGDEFEAVASRGIAGNVIVVIVEGRKIKGDPSNRFNAVANFISIELLRSQIIRWER
jgi:hypothetical protein